MSARILVVDDVPTNVKILQAKLEASYYEVSAAYSGQQALDKVAVEQPDLILLDVMMPGMDGFEVCRRLKADPATALIPIVMVTALDQVADRVRGLEAGADDFLTKPPNDTALFARVRSLVRIKMMIDELRLRDETYKDFGLDEASLLAAAAGEAAGSVLIVEPEEAKAKATAVALSRKLRVDVRAVPSGGAALDLAKSAPPDLLLASLRLPGEDGLRLCSELRSRRETKASALIVLAEPNDFGSVAAALDLGASDYLMRPIDEQELVARARTQLKRKRYADKLRENVHAEMRLALTDSLTGLHNRRYADQHLDRLLARGRRNGAPLAVMVLDIDRFKSVNDTYGHAAGDVVLVEFARRVAEEVRGVDLVCRYGGEEFLVVTPDAPVQDAAVIAERIRSGVAARPFSLGRSGAAGGQSIDVTVSIGVAAWDGPDETAAEMVARADAALYASKSGGRDRVTVADMAPGAAAAAGVSNVA